MNMADQEKKMTRYDMKQQRRKEGKKEGGGVKMLAVACFAFLAFWIGVFAYQTIESQKEKNETYVTIGEHEIKKAEYDYYFYSGINTMYSYYGSYLSYFGLDLSQDLSTQYYSETMTWKDYFDEQAIMQLQQVYALADAAEAEGFVYDTKADGDAFAATVESSAASAGYSTGNYVKAAYGEYATVKTVKEFVERDSYAGAYYEKLQEGTEVTDEEITAYYEENKASYDSVDYLVCMVEADIVTEEEVEIAVETEAETVVEETEAETTEETVEEEAEEDLTAAAMEEAKIVANEMLSKITDEASFEELALTYATDAEAEIHKENVKQSAITPSAVATWLFDDARQAGDSTVIEYTSGNAYYVVYFQNRYLDESKTVDVRHILIPFETVESTEDMTEEEIAEAEEAAKAAALATAEGIYDEWQEGDATEESFAALAEAHSTDTGSNTNGGLYEAVAKDEMVESFNDWIFDEVRQPGDSDIVESTYGYHIMFFVADNEMAWKLDVESVIRDNKLNDYVESLMEAYEVVDVNGNIPFLHVEDAVVETEAVETETAEETVTETEAE